MHPCLLRRIHLAPGGSPILLYDAGPPVYLPEVLATNMWPRPCTTTTCSSRASFLLDTAQLVGARCYITNEYQHDGSALPGGSGTCPNLLDLLPTEAD